VEAASTSNGRKAVHITTAAAEPVCPKAAALVTCPVGTEASTDKSLVYPTAETVAQSIAQLSQILRMKQQNAVESFLAGRRVVIAKFVAHRYKEVQNKAKKVVGIVNLYEVQCADGKAPTVQTWCPRSVQTIDQATKECPCQLKDGQKVVVEFDLMEPNTFDAKNGVLIRAGSLLPLE